MIANEVERKIGIRNTRAFIEASPSKIRLKRPRKAKTPVGGVKKLTPLTLAEQTFRIVPMSGLVWDRSRTTPDEGEVADVTEQLIGLPDADVRKNDYFPADDGGFFRVTHVSPVTGYRREARLQYVDTEPTA